MKKKKNIISFCIALLALLLVLMTVLMVGACTEYDLGDNTVTKEANVLINITTSGTNQNKANTRATAENAINNAIVLVYNASQVFEKSGDVNHSNSITFTLREGKKYIFVVANPSSTLRAKLEANPTYTTLVDMLSETGDYNAGNLPAQGLLMSGKIEKTISASTANTVNVELTFCVSRIELYIRKGSSDVENIVINSLTFVNVHNRGYLFKSEMYTAKATNTVTLLNNKVDTYTAGTNGTQIGLQYTYPTIKATDIAFTVTLKHANAPTTDTYTIYPNVDNDSATGSTFECGKLYKVIVTFDKDEQGKLEISTFTKIDTEFTIG